MLRAGLHSRLGVPTLTAPALGQEEVRKTVRRSKALRHGNRSQSFTLRTVPVGGAAAGVDWATFAESSW